MMFATSPVHVRSGRFANDTSASTQDLTYAASRSGRFVLRELTSYLEPENLYKLTRTGLQIIYLLVFGTILSAGYARRPLESPLLYRDHDNCTGSVQFQTLWDAKQEQLCRMLAHYLVFVSSQLNVPVPQSMERPLLDTAHLQWGQKASFSWNSGRPRETSASHKGSHNGRDNTAGSFMCGHPYCRRPFRRQSSLNRHMQRHARPFACMWDKYSDNKAESRTTDSTANRSASGSVADPGPFVADVDLDSDLDWDSDCNIVPIDIAERGSFLV